MLKGKKKLVCLGFYCRNSCYTTTMSMSKRKINKNQHGEENDCCAIYKPLLQIPTESSFKCLELVSCYLFSHFPYFFFIYFNFSHTPTCVIVPYLSFFKMTFSCCKSFYDVSSLFPFPFFKHIRIHLTCYVLIEWVLDTLPNIECHIGRSC
jgi:hypothetical protein